MGSSSSNVCHSGYKKKKDKLDPRTVRSLKLQGMQEVTQCFQVCLTFTTRPLTRERLFFKNKSDETHLGFPLSFPPCCKKLVAVMASVFLFHTLPLNIISRNKKKIYCRRHFFEHIFQIHFQPILLPVFPGYSQCSTVVLFCNVKPSMSS